MERSDIQELSAVPDFAPLNPGYGQNFYVHRHSARNDG
jgi:hypothetical protein